MKFILLLTAVSGLVKNYIGIPSELYLKRSSLLVTSSESVGLLSFNNKLLFRHSLENCDSDCTAIADVIDVKKHRITKSGIYVYNSREILLFDYNGKLVFKSPLDCLSVYINSDDLLYCAIKESLSVLRIDESALELVSSLDIGVSGAELLVQSSHWYAVDSVLVAQIDDEFVLYKDGQMEKNQYDQLVILDHGIFYKTKNAIHQVSLDSLKSTPLDGFNNCNLSYMDSTAFLIKCKEEMIVHSGTASLYTFKHNEGIVARHKDMYVSLKLQNGWLKIEWGGRESGSSKVDFDQKLYGNLVLASVRYEEGLNPIVAFTTSDGTLHFFNHDKIAFQNYEAMSQITAFGSLSLVRKEAIKYLDYNGKLFDMYARRVQRQLKELLLWDSKQDEREKIGEQRIIFGGKGGKVFILNGKGEHLWQLYYPGVEWKFVCAIDGIVSLVGDDDNTHVLKIDLEAENVVGYTTKKGKVEFATVHDKNLVILFKDQLNVRGGGETDDLYYYKGVKGTNQLFGYAIRSLEKQQSLPAWTITFPETEVLVTSSGNGDTGAVASLGRVLGNGSVLYKHLSPNLVGFITRAPDYIAVYLIDTVSGKIHNRFVHENVGQTTPNILKSENTFVYTFWNNNQTVKHHQAVVLEVYESKQPNVRHSNGSFTAFSGDVGIFANSFVLPGNVVNIGVTRTLGGITTKEFIFAYSSGAVHGIRKNLLDPLRSLKLSNDDKSIGILPYNPSVPLLANDIVSREPIFGVKHIAAIPTDLESTSITVIYGLDLYVGIRTPSMPFDTLKEGFSYLQLILSIAALFVGISVTAHYSEKKLLSESWS